MIYYPQCRRRLAPCTLRITKEQPTAAKGIERFFCIRRGQLHRKRRQKHMEILERNAPCWCGSGKKYKKCHEAFDEKLKMYENKGVLIPSHEIIKTPSQIEKIRESAKINIAVLDYVAEHISQGSPPRKLMIGCIRSPQRQEESLRLWIMKAIRRVCVPPLMTRCAMEYPQKM